MMPHRFRYFFLRKRHAIKQTLVFGVAVGQVFRSRVSPSQRAASLNTYVTRVRWLSRKRSASEYWEQGFGPGDLHVARRRVVLGCTSCHISLWIGEFLQQHYRAQYRRGPCPSPRGEDPSGEDHLFRYRRRPIAGLRGPCRSIPVVSFWSDRPRSPHVYSCSPVSSHSMALASRSDLRVFAGPADLREREAHPPAAVLQVAGFCSHPKPRLHSWPCFISWKGNECLCVTVFFLSCSQPAVHRAAQWLLLARDGVHQPRSWPR